MSVNVYCFGNEMPNSIGAAKGNNQIFLQDNLHFCSAIGWKKLAGKRYNGKTLRYQTYARRHIYLAYNLISLNIPAAFEQYLKMLSVKLKCKSL